MSRVIQIGAQFLLTGRPHAALGSGCGSLNHLANLKFAPSSLERHLQLAPTPAFLYELPFGTGKQFSTGNHLVDYIVGNWQVNGIFTARTGQVFNVLAGGDIANTGNASTYERANLVGNPYQVGPIAANPACTPRSGPMHTTTQWFNPCAFATPAIGTLGNSPRNFLHGQNLWNLDTSVYRLFPIREGVALTLDVEAFNVFNHPVQAIRPPRLQRNLHSARLQEPPILKESSNLQGRFSFRPSGGAERSRKRW